MGPLRPPDKAPPACRAHRGVLTAAVGARTLPALEGPPAVCYAMFAIAPISPARVGAIAAIAMLLGAGAAAQQAHVAVTSIVETASFDAVRSGLRDGCGTAVTPTAKICASLSTTPAQAWTWRRASPTAWRRSSPTLSSPSPSPSAVAMLRAPAAAPIVFAAVGPRHSLPAEISDGVEAARATGLTTSAPIGEVLALIKEIGPDVLTVGLLFPQARRS